MQGLTESPRGHLTGAQVTDLLNGQGVKRGFGLELLDANNAVVEDISADCKGFTVSHDNGAEVHGSVSMQLARELSWGTARVRPFLTFSKNGVTARFNLGVFVLTTPSTTHGRTPKVYQVSGRDLTYLLDRQIADTYVVIADGAKTYMQALREVLAASGVGGTPMLDGTRQDTVLPQAMVWGLTQAPRWLDVANDLMAGIAYTDVWNDHNGVFRARPVADDATRPIEWSFDTTDQATDLVAQGFAETYDGWNAPNVWRFVRTRLAYQPFEGDGIFEWRNETEGLSAIAVVGERPKPVEFLDVADQATLEAEGWRIINADRRAERRFSINVDPLPIAGHMDVVALRHDSAVYKLQVASWQVSTSGKTSWVLGSDGVAVVRKRSEQQTTATVTAASPLRVVVDGATVDSPANALMVEDPTTGVLSAPTYAIGQRVTTTVRNPQPPLVQGVET